MRLVKIGISHGYIVDADNQEMVDHATDALYDDLAYAAQFDELMEWIEMLPAPLGATERDIPSWMDEEDSDEKLGGGT
jgi:hypothetical protein